ncbi:protein ALTERED PHOSPHATE STARVATION RESPONSE 1-like [Pyrus communis]|uniref:protein ALTERED PHOSPHATE STARVATION RESPONSE 1-like n=1 Tax=Pyrus communis TaxID=23211 RepID=UPI0035BFFE1A
MGSAGSKSKQDNAKRKDLMKSVKMNRYAFAGALREHILALLKVAEAIKLFVESHSFEVSMLSSNADRGNELQENSDGAETDEEQEEVDQTVQSPRGDSDCSNSDGDRKEVVKISNERGRERELLEALKDVEDYFRWAYDSVGRMILRKSSLRSSSTRACFDSGLLGDKGSPSHSLTLGKLYALDENLYSEQKVIEETEVVYDRKSEDLDTKIYEIEIFIMKNSKKMSEFLEAQRRIMSEVNSLKCPSNGTLCNDSNHVATWKLEKELLNWSTRFASYVSSQKAYVTTLDRWLAKWDDAETESKLKSNGVNPSSLAICRHWSDGLDKLPYQAVTCAINSFAKDVRSLRDQQHKERRQKGVVDKLARRLGRENFLQDTDLKEQMRTEKKKLHTITQKTWDIAVNGFQTRFSKVFGSKAKFFDSMAKLFSEPATKKSGRPSKNACGTRVKAIDR